MNDEPLRTTTFTLTRADALAYEQAAARLTPLASVALVVWLGLCAAASLLPPDWAGPRFGWAFATLCCILVALGYLSAQLLIAVRQLLAARRRLRRAVEVTVTEWPDRLSVVASGLPRELAFADIRRVVATGAHLFLVHDEDVLILPRAAFVEEGALEALALACARPASAAVDPAVPSA